MKITLSIIGFCLLLMWCAEYEVYDTPYSYLTNDMYASEVKAEGDVILKLVHHVTKDECVEAFGKRLCRGDYFGTIVDYPYSQEGIITPCHNAYQFKEGDELYIVGDTRIYTVNEFINRCQP